MKLQMHAVVRGERVEFSWINGGLTGNAELLDRFRRANDMSPVDTTDPAAVLTCLENILGEQPSVDLIAR